VNFSSVAVPLKLAGEAAYVASKSAVVALTHVLAREFAEFGITVNCVGPGPLATNLIRSVPKQTIDRLLAQQAIRRMGRSRTSPTRSTLPQAGERVRDRSDHYLGGV